MVCKNIIATSESVRDCMTILGPEVSRWPHDSHVPFRCRALYEDPVQEPQRYSAHPEDLGQDYRVYAVDQNSRQSSDMVSGAAA